MSKSNKTKIIENNPDDLKYYHPKLEEQIIIRFSEDLTNLAKNLREKMENNEFTDFEITFTDAHHATVKIGEDILQGLLLDLPTIVETHRTVDGSHLFKSADIG
jgi:transcription initiation factor TFIID subunit 7